MNSHCLDCHKEIAWQAQRDLGLHGQEKLKDCARCHPDHAGPDFELISWGRGGPEQFDHRRSGWPLEGRHAALKCRDCHKPELRKAPVAGMLQRKKPEDSWLGLERDCLSCHRDYHQETLDPDCRLCHGLTRWTPTRQFDHGKSPFALDGKHADVACEKCHLIPGRVSMTGDRGQAIPRYKPVPHRECSDCHADPHRERLGPGCAGCHVVEGFEQVDRKAFDHSKTRYPLLGRHAAVQCAECHDPDEAWGDKPPFDRCGSCHADPHAGRATLAARQVDCAACHDEQRFKPATYTVTDHQSSAYPLEGKHAAVPCDKCHPKHPSTVPSVELGLAGVLIRPAHQECGACHQDAHADQLAGRPGGSACESCHHVNGWKPSTYTTGQHAALKLPLEGRHLEVECGACHALERQGLPPLPGKDVLGTAAVALTLIEAECGSCHYDPHDGRFAPQGERPKSGCPACHGVREFHPSTVDAGAHREFAYPLEGAHRATPCLLCHEELKLPQSSIKLLRVAGSARSLTFKGSHERCEDCHETPHGEQFAGRVDGGSCGGCHVVETFRPASRFDHDQDAAFSLEGAHRNVSCDRCHPAGADGGPRQVLYRPIAHRCQDCHRSIPGQAASGADDSRTIRGGRR
jgi:hypothetical protein